LFGIVSVHDKIRSALTQSMSKFLPSWQNMRFLDHHEKTVQLCTLTEHKRKFVRR
jgi:hypothetical protein